MPQLWGFLPSSGSGLRVMVKLKLGTSFTFTQRIVPRYCKTKDQIILRYLCSSKKDKSVGILEQSRGNCATSEVSWPRYCFVCPWYENAPKFRNKMANITYRDLFSNPGTRLNLNW